MPIVVSIVLGVVVVILASACGLLWADVRSWRQEAERLEEQAATGWGRAVLAHEAWAAAASRSRENRRCALAAEEAAADLSQCLWAAGLERERLQQKLARIQAVIHDCEPEEDPHA